MIRYLPLGMLKLPMRSLCSTWKYPGQTRSDGGCGGVGGTGLVYGVTRSPTLLLRPARKVRVESVATQGRGRSPSQSSRNSENSWEASVQPIDAESSTVIT